MSKTDAERHIRNEKHRVGNVDELVGISHRMWDVNKGPTTNGIPHSVAEEVLELELEKPTYRSFEHLVDADMLEKFPEPGTPDTWAIADWRENGIVNGEVPEAASEGIENLIADFQDEDSTGDTDSSVVADGAGTTKRAVIATELNVAPETLEQELREGDPVDKLNDAVEALEEHDEIVVGDDYDKIRFANPKNHYRLTKFAVRLYEQ